jgi:hypothetical protein
VHYLSYDRRLATLFGQYLIKAVEGPKIWGATAKVQLLSKCPYGVIIWTKIPTRNLTNFCPSGEINKIKALSYDTTIYI